MDRRRFLKTVGCSLAASPLITPVTLAAAPWDTRLVVIILRGGMDGLDVVQPYGDLELAGLRTRLVFGEEGGAHDLDGFYALHPALSDLMPLWQAGQLGFVHAVSTPYRDKRSHFDGQDLLEAGTETLGDGPPRDGWLNRMLQVVPGVSAQTAFAIGRDQMLLLSGEAPVAEWSPDADLNLSPQAQRLLELVYHDDPLFRDAASEAIAITASLKQDNPTPTGDEAGAGMMEMVQNARRGGSHLRVAEFAASRLVEDSRVAAFSINGWDTHANQRGGLRRALTRLQDTILTLQQGLGPVWDKTAVLALTEFGRTARENGTNGTDHGTAGAAIMAGGAIRGGRVYGDWPGLAYEDLYAGRDLMPTADVRAYAAWAMRGVAGLDRNVIENSIFPGLLMGDDPRIIA